jgi:hypothetical protein
MNRRPKRWTREYGFQVMGKWRNPKKDAKLVLLGLMPIFLFLFVLFLIYLKSLCFVSFVTIPLYIFIVALLGREALKKESRSLGIPIIGKGEKKELNERTFSRSFQAVTDVLDQMELKYDCSRDYLLATFQLLEWDLTVRIKPLSLSHNNPASVIDFKPSAVPPGWIRHYDLTLMPLTEKNRSFVADFQEKLSDELVRAELIISQDPSAG